jgi:hypothetical protein
VCWIENIHNICEIKKHSPSESLLLNYHTLMKTMKLYFLIQHIQIFTNLRHAKNCVKINIFVLFVNNKHSLNESLLLNNDTEMKVIITNIY